MRRVACALVFTALAAPLFAQATPDGRPSILRNVAIEQHLDRPLPLDLRFRDEAGRAVRLGEYFGKRPVVLVLAYYDCPMLCTQVLNGLLAAMRVLSFDAGREYEVVTVSFDPRDDPSDARAKKEPYVAKYGRAGAAAGWHFLTGEPAAIAGLAEAVGFRYAWGERQEQFAHASAIYVATPDGRLSRYFYGIEYAPRDLRLALVEASRGKIGTPVDQLLLYCYHYDPAAGRYGAVVMNMVRVAGVAFVLVLSAFLFLMWRRERRRLSQRPHEA
ncbi:MAG TPA: SCO family protein [Thermoanaerobaculia bacterium]|jgi:protein SCO1/2|nr:SCO family protein [Thermoanaerobaculia bacterium]